jgi:hypothetical protein
MSRLIGTDTALEIILLKIINRLATPLTTGLFAVSTISGIALFFHWAPGSFHAMHEWLSLALLAPFAFHLWKNWNAFLGYARRGTLLLPLAACLVIAIPFAIPSFKGETGGNPAFKALQLMTQARLADLAPIVQVQPEMLIDRLRKQGYSVASLDETPNSVAATSGVPATAILAALTAR